MKTLCLLLVSVAFSYAADPRQPDIRKAHEGFVKCWDDRKASCMEQVITPDFVFVARPGLLQTRDEFLSALEEGRMSRGFTVPAGANTRFYGSTAIVTYENTGGRPSVHTHVWVNVDGKG